MVSGFLSSIFRRRLVFCMVAWLLPAMTIEAGDWPMWRYDAYRSSTTPDALPDDMKPLWVRHLPRPQPAWPPDQGKLQFDQSYPLIVIGDAVIVPSMVSDSVTAYDTATGAQRWRFYADGPVRFAPVAGNGKIWFVSDDGHLYCLSADDGTLRWKHRGAPDGRRVLGNDRMISAWPARGAPVLRDGVIYYAAGIWPFMGTFIYALDAETGREIWCNSGSGSNFLMQQHSSPAFAGVAPQGYLVATEHTLLVSGGRTLPAAYDRKTGAFLYYHVASRQFGKDAGGFDVLATDKWFFNNGAMYRTRNGDGLLQADPFILMPDGMIHRDGLAIICRAIEPIEEEVTNRKGEKEKRLTFKESWSCELETPISRIFLRAGNRLYASGRKGLICAIDLPEGDNPLRISWQTTIGDQAWTMAAGDDKLFVVTHSGVLHCFGRNDLEPRIHERPEPVIPDGADRATWAEVVADAHDGREPLPGYTLVIGGRDKALLAALLETSDDHIIVLEPDPDRVRRLRQTFDDAAQYGRRVHVLPDDIFTAHLPPCFANFIVISDGPMLDQPFSGAFVRHVFEALRPYGGRALFPGKAADIQPVISHAVSAAPLARAKIDTHDFGLILTREGALPGSADWTHQHADAANSVVSKDTLVKAPLGLLWFGGPTNQGILPRHGHGPTPQVVGGRLFIEGPDLLRAVDVYTGKLLWERDLPDIGRNYDYTSHEPGANAIGSNYASAHDGIYIVQDKTCRRLDPATGKTLKTFHLPPNESDGRTPDWGFIALDGDLMIAGAQPMSFWSPAFTFDEFRHVKPEEVSRIVASMAELRGFQTLPRKDGEEDEDFLVKNLNRLLIEEDLISILPQNVVSTEGRDDKWTQRFNRIRQQLRQTVAGDLPDRATTLKELNRRLLQHVYPLPRNDRPAVGKFNLEHTASKRLVAMNRHTGEVLWEFEAEYALRHNTIVVGGGNVFCIDRLPDPYLDYLQRRGKRPPHDARVLALNARTGEEQWSTYREVFGTWLGYSTAHDTLIQAGAKGRDRLFDEVGHGMVAYEGNTGDVLWTINDEYGGPVMLYHDTIITQEKAFSLKTGAPIRRTHPLTGQPVPWTYNRHYGCGTAVASEHLLTFRSAAAGFFDLTDSGGTGNLGGFKSGCTSNLIVANGVLNAPDYTRTCTCSYQNQASLALIHDPGVEVWTFSNLPKPADRIVRLGLNLGAPGDRLAADGTLWLDYPSTGGQSPDVPVDAQPESSRWYRHHASLFYGEEPTWIVASGAEGLESLTITLAAGDVPAWPFTLRLSFAEPDESVDIGERVFNVSINNAPVLKNFDIVRQAEVPRRGIAVTVPDVMLRQILTLHLTPAENSKRPPLLCGLELIAAR